MKHLIDKAADTHNLTVDEIVSVLKDTHCDEYLFQKANEIREQYVGKDVHLRALIEFSNICKRNCRYCGLQAENSRIERYAMTPEEIYKTAKSAVLAGYKTIVLQSGESEKYPIELLCKIIGKIKLLNVAVTLSIGEKTSEEYDKLKEAGADRFLLRVETTDFGLYEKLHPEMSLNNRKACLRYLKRAGFETGTGNLVGLPNQTDISLANDILFFKKLDADMVGLGPFIPSPDTPLRDEIGGTVQKAVKVMAIVRLLMPDINIPATTAMETLLPNGRVFALNSGANVVMQNVNSPVYQEKYNLYPNKQCFSEDVKKNRKNLEDLIFSIGRTVGQTYGFRNI